MIFSLFWTYSVPFYSLLISSGWSLSMTIVFPVTGTIIGKYFFSLFLCVCGQSTQFFLLFLPSSFSLFSIPSPLPAHSVFLLLSCLSRSSLLISLSLSLFSFHLSFFLRFPSLIPISLRASLLAIPGSSSLLCYSRRRLHHSIFLTCLDDLLLCSAMLHGQQTSPTFR